MSNQLDLPVRQAGTHLQRHQFLPWRPPPFLSKYWKRDPTCQDCFISSIYHLWPSNKCRSTADLLSVCDLYILVYTFLHVSYGSVCVYVETLLQHHTFQYSALIYLFSVLYCSKTGCLDVWSLEKCLSTFFRCMFFMNSLHQLLCVFCVIGSSLTFIVRFTPHSFSVLHICQLTAVTLGYHSGKRIKLSLYGAFLMPRAWYTWQCEHLMFSHKVKLGI